MALQIRTLVAVLVVALAVFVVLMMIDNGLALLTSSKTIPSGGTVVIN